MDQFYHTVVALNMLHEHVFQTPVNFDALSKYVKFTFPLHFEEGTFLPSAG